MKFDTVINNCLKQKTPPVPQITPNLLIRTKPSLSTGSAEQKNATEDLTGNHPAHALMPVRQHNHKVN